MARKRKNRYKERIEKGNYTSIPNEILEVASQQYLKPLETKVLFFLLRKIWGWEKDWEIISLDVFQKSLQFEKKHIRRALVGLQKKGIILQLGKKIYEIQLDIDKWKVIRKERKKEKRPQLGNQRPQLGNKSSLKRSIDKEQQTPRTTILRTTILKKTTTRKTAAVSSSSQKDKPKKQTLPPGLLEFILPKFLDTGWHTLKRQELSELILIAIQKGKSDIPNYFRYWKKEIDKKKSIHNKPGYLIKMVEQGYDPPLYEEAVKSSSTSRRDDKYDKLIEKYSN